MDVAVLADQQESVQTPVLDNNTIWRISDSGCSLEDQAGAMDNTDGWKERKSRKKLCHQGNLMMIKYMNAIPWPIGIKQPLMD